MKLRVLDLFSGIGGFSLGLERAGGFETVAFCEIEDFPKRVIRKHWPEVPIYDDVRTLNAGALARDGIAVDVICGGFPCQDISQAGVGAGLDGERSGLWREYCRLIREVRPAFVIVENVAALLSRGHDVVLGDLAEIGYDAEWHSLGATYAGVPQSRPRVWIIAYPTRSSGGPIFHQNAEHVERYRAWLDEPCSHMADADNEGRGACAVSVLGNIEWTSIPNRERSGSDGRLSGGVDRYKAIGNAVIPQIPELIGRAILEAHNRT
jgi:DNA (cytosine-5)-methyltransferase 1